MKIGFVFFSCSDVTGKLMTEANKALLKLGLETVFHKIEGEEIYQGRFVNTALIEQLTECDGIIFGSPTYMGSVSAQFKAFADSTSAIWDAQAWSGKLAAGVTSGTGLNGNQSSTLQYFSVLASQHGMLWLGLDAPFSDKNKSVNRLGCQLGVTSHSLDGTVAQIDINSAVYLATRMAHLIRKKTE